MKKLFALVALILFGLLFYSYNRPQELLDKSIKIDKIIVEKSKMNYTI